MRTDIQPASVPELQPARTRERVLVGNLIEVRIAPPSASGDGSYIVEGYAAVTEQETTLYDGQSFSMREIISRGAFENCLGDNPTVHLNIGHDMNQVMASTAVSGVGGLQLAEDFHGLRFEARVPPLSYAADAVELMRLGVINQASFAFTIGAEEIDDEGETPDGVQFTRYRINSIKNLYDVCVTPQGAYPQTESAARTLFGAHFGRLGLPEGHQGRSLEGPTQVAATEQGQPVTDTHDEEQARRARERERGRLWLLKE